MHWVRRAVVASIVAVSLACQAGDPPVPRVPACAALPSADAAGWRVVDRRAFRFALPPEFVRVPVQPIDSWVEVFATPDSAEQVSFDAGTYSNDLRRDPEAYAEYAACRAEIGGRWATVVTARVRNPHYPPQDGRLVAAAAWRNVAPGWHLTFWAETRDRRALARLQAVLRTVRFADTVAGGR